MRVLGLGVCIFSVGMVFPAVVAGAPPQLLRGPYLQLGTSESAVVRWRTDVATSSRVAWGTVEGVLGDEVTDPQLVTEHEVELMGLVPATRYFYAVGTDALWLAGPDPERAFVTAPVPGSRVPARVWVLGDSGTATAGAAAVRDGFLAFNAGQAPDLWLMLGDNAYVDGTDTEYQAAVFEMYPTVLERSWLWPTLGNHDGHSADSATQTGPYYDIFTLPTLGEAGGMPSGTEAYYSFDWANLHLVCLDSYDSPRDPAGAMLQWLTADLAATTQDWVVAYWHHPPYTKGSHDSDNPADSGNRLFEMRENVLPVLENAGVDLVLTGHSHSYERSYLLDGHYGTSDTFNASMFVDPGDGRTDGDGAYDKLSGARGAVYVVAGSSARFSGGTLDHPALPVTLAETGSLVLDVHGRRLDVLFVDATGTVREAFTLLKDSAVFADGFESGGFTAWSASVP